MNSENLLNVLNMILNFILWKIIRTIFITITMFILNYIVSSITLYKTAKIKGKTNAIHAWCPVLRDLLIIRLGQGNKLCYLTVLLLLVPVIRYPTFIFIYLYLTFMTSKVIKEYDSYYKLFVLSKVIPLIYLLSSPLGFINSYCFFSILSLISLIKTCRNINAANKKSKNYS